MKKTNENNKNRKLIKELSIIKIILFILLALYSISLLLPIVWGVINSFKDILSFTEDPLNFPPTFHIGNYSDAYEGFFVVIIDGLGNRSVRMEEMVLNSVLYALVGSFLNVLVLCVMGYAVERFNNKVSKIILATVIITMMIPIVGALPSEIQMLKFLHLYDSIYGIWIMKSNFMGMYFLVFHAFFSGIPKEYSEAASVDGASNLRVMMNIILPFAKNLFLTIMLIKFIEFWNDYQAPLVYFPSKPTLSYGLYKFNLSSYPLATYTTV